MKIWYSLFILSFGLISIGCGDDTDPVAGDDFRDAIDDTIVDTDDVTVDMRDVDAERDDPVVDREIEPVVCTEAEGCFDSFPVRILDTTVGGAREWNAYACDPDTNEGGAERVYRVELAEPGFFAAEIVAEETTADIDVHLLFENDNESCLDRGHYTAGSYLQAGAYYVVADTWVDENGFEYDGEFELALNLVRASDLIDHGMNEAIADDAITAFANAWSREETDRFEYTITDFSMHSQNERQWIVQLATGELLYHLTVGHGEASIPGEDLGMSTLFSNIPESHQSSLGLIRTAEPYTGDYGYSMRLDGLEPGFNDNVRTRDIVVHPWDGNLSQVVATEGWVVQTWGCPSITPQVSTPVVDLLSGGSLMFFWYPDPQWRNASTYLEPVR